MRAGMLLVKKKKKVRKSNCFGTRLPKTVHSEEPLIKEIRTTQRLRVASCGVTFPTPALFLSVFERVGEGWRGGKNTGRGGS
ncbi:hypothetical protein CEXT_686671 [Caerostris extrusa]|uniref:Uncharacterized protein n=1 Tax=Caerostris extrusa TaxID=172846 RepID=A0AAV4QY72_CAEEX|nr:hypothetical protein CEXT_686671 [Caerostris extrusa]